MRPVLYLVICAAPPARQIEQLVQLLLNDHWNVCVIATPTAATWIDRDYLSELTGHPVRFEQRHPDDRKSAPKADAIAVVPATFNTINKWATGISDNLALGILNEALGLGIPILVSPYAKPILTRHFAYAHHVQMLTAAGATFTEDEALRPNSQEESYRWQLIREALQRLVESHLHRHQVRQQ